MASRGVSDTVQGWVPLPGWHLHLARERIPRAVVARSHHWPQALSPLWHSWLCCSSLFVMIQSSQIYSGKPERRSAVAAVSSPLCLSPWQEEALLFRRLRSRWYVLLLSLPAQPRPGLARHQRGVQWR